MVKMNAKAMTTRRPAKPRSSRCTPCSPFRFSCDRSGVSDGDGVGDGEAVVGGVAVGDGATVVTSPVGAVVLAAALSTPANRAATPSVATTMRARRVRRRRDTTGGHTGDLRVSEVEQVTQEPFPTPSTVAAIAIVTVAAVMPAITIVIAAGRVVSTVVRGRRHRASGTIDDLVQFTSVQPHATALRAVVDLYA